MAGYARLEPPPQLPLKRKSGGTLEHNFACAPDTCRCGSRHRAASVLHPHSPGQTFRPGGGELGDARKAGKETKKVHRTKHEKQGSAEPRGGPRAFVGRSRPAPDAARLHLRSQYGPRPHHIGERRRRRGACTGSWVWSPPMTSRDVTTLQAGTLCRGLRVPIPEYAIAIDKVRYVGEPVVMVAAARGQRRRRSRPDRRFGV